MVWGFRSLVDVVVPWIRSGRKVRKSQKPPQTMRPRGLQIEPLEVRHMLNVAPIMPDLLVNSPGSHIPRLADSGNAVAAGPAGSFNVVYATANQDGDGLGIFGQQFAADGTPVGGEFQVNVTTAGDQQRPSLAKDASGNAVYVWQSSGQDGSQTGVYGRRFSAAGVPLGGEFQVNQTTLDAQQTPSVAFLTNGQFIVVWAGKGAGDNSGVFGRRFDSSGNPLGGEFLINTYTDNEQKLPDVAALPSGGFLVAWQSHGNQDGSGSGIYAQRFDAGGSRVGGEFRVNTTTQSFQEYASIGVGKDGQFAIAWQSNLQDSSGYGIFAQRFDASGAPVDGEIAVNTTTADDQLNPSVAYNAKGGFAISWHGKGTGDNAGVFVREFDANGVALGPEQRVNTPTDGTQRYATIVAASSGYAMVWSGAGATVSDGVFLRRLGSGPVSSGIADVQDLEDAPNRSINLWNTFDDAENADSQLSYQVTSNTNAALFSQVLIDPATGNLTLDYAPNANGVAQLTVRATDPGGLFVESQFAVNVVAVNDRPVAVGLGDVTIAPGVRSLSVHVGEAFSDIDNSVDQLTYELVGNTNPALFESTKVVGSGGWLALVPAAQASGEAVLTVRATDPGGLSAQQSFTVTVLPGVRAVTKQSEVLVRSGSDPKAVDLNAIFQNVDGTSAGLSYQVVSNSNPSLVTANLEVLQGVLQISAKPQAIATSVIVIKATNAAGLWATHELLVSASPTNVAPRIASLATGPEPTIEGSLLHLEARGVVDDGTVAKVSFYRDTNGNGVLDPAADQLLGVDTNGADGWKIDVATTGFGSGAHRYFARAMDNLKVFGNVATVTGTIGKYAIADNDGPAYSEVGQGWTTLSASGDFLTTHRQHAPGTGEAKALWTFGGLAAASYKVCVTWSARAGLASNAPFAIYDGTELLATVHVDQQVAPDDVQEDGTWWLDVGTYQIRHGQVRVELSNAADGLIAADAVRLVDPPTIGSFTADCTQVTAGAWINLTAGNVSTENESGIQSVYFYLDSNGSGSWEIESDACLATGSNSSASDWNASVSTDGMSTGTHTLFAVANDSDGAGVASLSVTIESATIVEASISGPTSVEAGSPYSLDLNRGSQSVTSWTIYWGDGNYDTVNESVPSFSHVYQTGSTYTISATALVNDVNQTLNSIYVDVLSPPPPPPPPGENSPPVANDLSVTLGRNATVALWPSAYDPDGGSPLISYSSVPSHGWLSTNGSSDSWTYTPFSGFLGTDSFTYQVSDGSDCSNYATVSINVVNNPPVANDASYSLDGTSSLTFFPTDISYDPDGDVPTIDIDNPPSYGTLWSCPTPEGALRWYYWPNGHHGVDTFSYHVHDSEGAQSNTATVTITVDKPPIAQDVSLTVGAHGSGLFWPSVSDLDNDSLSVSVPSWSEHGSISWDASANTWRYQPDWGFAGADWFTYQAGDGYMNSNYATVSINVVNIAPVVTEASFSVDEDHPFTDSSALGYDPEGEVPGIVIGSGPSHGSVFLGGSWNGYGWTSWQYTPSPNYWGPDSFTYRLVDSFGAEPNSAGTVTITVNPVGDSGTPTANNDSLGAYENTPLIFWPNDLLANDFDPDGDQLTLTGIDSPSGTSIVQNLNGSWAFSATNIGTYSTSYYATDGWSSYSGTITFTVSAAPPTAISLSCSSVAENQPEETMVGTLQTTVPLSEISNLIAA